MFKVRTVSLGRILTFSTAVLYLGYLWYKRKRTLSHHQSDKKRLSSEPSELIKTEIDDQELLQALEKASRSLEISQVVEEEPTESLIDHCEEIMEPTVVQVEIHKIESLNSEVHKLDTNINMVSNEQRACLDPKIISTIDSLTENLNNLKLSSEVDQENVIENIDSINNQQVGENIKKEEKLSDNKTQTKIIENENHCECPKAVNDKKKKEDEEPMLFDGIKFKGKKKRNRKKNKDRNTITLPTESHNKNKTYDVEKPAIKNIPIVEEDCDSAHSVDHSIDTNDAPNTIYSDIRSEVSSIFYI